jgi:tRNA dimethylallyltransferase
MTTPRAILIAGPTASGKSALALRWAEERGGAIVNADSMQVYRELRVLTARPPAAEEARVPHHLYGHVPGAEAYSAGRFVAEVSDAIATIEVSGRLPIIVGGTGLYFKALIDGLSPVPAIPDDVRSAWRTTAAEIGASELHAILASRDPEMAARLRPTDPQRVTRALEVLEATGRSLAYWQTLPGTAVLKSEDVERYVVSVERDELYRRCDARFERMLEGGALAEVEALAALGLPPGLPVMGALGVRPLMQLLAGNMSREDAAAQAKADTRKFVKRQITWIAGNMSAWKRVST